MHHVGRDSQGGYRRVFATGVALALALLAPMTQAWQYVPKTAAEVRDEADGVFAARVLEVEQRLRDDGRDLRLRLLPCRIYRGPAPPETLWVVHRQDYPYLYDERGEVMGWVSPIVTFSGQEFAMAAGSVWLVFVGAAKGKDPPVLLRAESIDAAAELFPEAEPDDGSGGPEPASQAQSSSPAVCRLR